MGFTRGLTFGVLVGLIGVFMGRGSRREARDPADESQTYSLLEEARRAAHDEADATQHRLRDRLEAARRSGRLPNDD